MAYSTSVFPKAPKPSVSTISSFTNPGARRPRLSRATLLRRSLPPSTESINCTCAGLMRGAPAKPNATPPVVKSGLRTIPMTDLGLLAAPFYICREANHTRRRFTQVTARCQEKPPPRVSAQQGIDRTALFVYPSFVSDETRSPLCEPLLPGHSKEAA